MKQNYKLNIRENYSLKQMVKPLVLTGLALICAGCITSKPNVFDDGSKEMKQYGEIIRQQ